MARGGRSADEGRTEERGGIAWYGGDARPRRGLVVAASRLAARLRSDAAGSGAERRTAEKGRRRRQAARVRAIS